MAYNTKSIVKDVNGKPVPQYFNPITDKYEVVESGSGRLKMNIVDSEGREIQSQNLVEQIANKLDELIEVVK